MGTDGVGVFTVSISINCVSIASSSPVITSIDPATGYAGDEVTIIGTDLEGAAVSFGGTDVDVVSESATELKVTVPDASAGFVDVTVTDGTTQSSLTNGFEIKVAPSITSLNPTSGSAGETITLSGTGLDKVQFVKFGSASAYVRSQAPTEMVVEVPATSVGTTDVSVTDGIKESRLTAAFTVLDTPQPPVFIVSPTGGFLPAATLDEPYKQTFEFSLQGDYTGNVLVGSLPPGLSLINGSEGPYIKGKPTEAGSFMFTIKFENANGDTAEAHYSIEVSAASSAGLAFSQASGTALPAGMAGEEYSAGLSASGGTGTLVYSLSGTYPAGLVINSATGQLTGPLDAGTEGDYAVTVKVIDALDASANATFTLSVAQRAVTVVDKVKTVPAGSTPTNVLLTEGATGGPFTDAIVGYVIPANAGKATVVMAETAQLNSSSTPQTFYLKFTPATGFSGQAVVGYTLVSALGVSNNGTVTYNLGFDPDAVVADIDSLVHGFLGARQGLIASSIELPTLLDRRSISQATSAVSGDLSPNGDGLLLSFGTSIVQANAAAMAAIDGLAYEAKPEDTPFNAWVNGTVKLFNNESSGDQWGTFAMLSAGADYLVSSEALVGVSFHLDRMTNPTDQDADLTGTGWLVGPYGSFEVGKNVFFNASLLYGGSDNTIDTAFFDGDFDTTRWMFDASLTGNWSIDDVTTITPRLRTVYLNEAVEAYTVSNGAGSSLIIDGFTEEQFRTSLGAEIKREFAFENGLTLTPRLGATLGYRALDDASVFGALSAGTSLAGEGTWGLDTDLLFTFDGNGTKSVGASATFRVNF